MAEKQLSKFEHEDHPDKKLQNKKFSACMIEIGDFLKELKRINKTSYISFIQRPPWNSLVPTYFNGLFKELWNGFE